MNTFIGKGNLGAQPVLKHVDVKSSDEPYPVAEMRVYFDHARPDGNGGYKDEGGFWADVTVWGRKAELVAKLLPKGARVCVHGTLSKDRWADKETGEARERDAILAEDITLDLSRVEEIRLRPARERDEAESAEVASEPPAAAGERRSGRRAQTARASAA